MQILTGLQTYIDMVLWHSLDKPTKQKITIKVFLEYRYVHIYYFKCLFHNELLP